MTRDEVIAMAREAGMALAIDDSRYGYMERFAALVAAAEREACAQVCDKLASVTLAYQNGSPDELANVMLRLVAELGHAEAPQPSDPEALNNHHSGPLRPFSFGSTA